MKLLNQSLKHLSISIFVIVTIWAAIFYLNMLHEIKGSMDEGLENHKRLIIANAQKDSAVLLQTHFDESFFTIEKITKGEAIVMKDRYLDTTIFMQDADDESPEPEPVRMLITAFEVDGQYYKLQIANSMVEEDDLIKALLWDVIWLYVVLIGGIVVINNVVLKKLWQPFYLLLEKIKKHTLGSDEKSLDVTTKTSEFIDLQNALNTHLNRSTKAFEQQKEFIGNAAHELQTPLAIATNKLELLLEKAEWKEEEVKSLAEVMEIIERLIRLNKSLLLLSKIDNKQFPETEDVSINSIVSDTVQELEDLAQFKGVVIQLSLHSEHSVQMDPSLCRVIISNLLKNAIIHNSSGGKVFIELHEKNLIVRNTGTDDMALDEKIFSRFNKSSAKGTGLGLAIVKAITDLYGFSIRYEKEGEFYAFTVLF